MTNAKEAILELLKELRWSEFRLAQACGFSYNTISKIVTGETKKIRIDTIGRIEEATGYKADIQGDTIHFRRPVENSSDDTEQRRAKECYEKISNLTEEAQEQVFKIIELLPTKER